MENGNVIIKFSNCSLCMGFQWKCLGFSITFSCDTSNFYFCGCILSSIPFKDKYYFWLHCLMGIAVGWLVCFVSQPHFEGSVRSPLTLLNMGLGSPLGLLKTQSAIARSKTPHIETFIIPLERSWSVDVQNGLAWAIWTSATQVMVKRRARSQIGNLIPDH